MNQIRKKHRMEISLLLLLMLFVAISIGSMLIFRKTISNSLVVNNNQNGFPQNHYVFISDDYTKPFTEQLYQGIRTSAEKEGCSVEYLGKDLSVSYSVAELIQIATKADVDGIFVIGNDTKGVTAAINQAVKKNIPVITVFQDCTMSKRQCFVGNNGYELGRQYAKKLCAIGEKGTKKVSLLVDANEEDASKNSVYLGIKKYLKQEGMEGKVQLQGIATQSKAEFTSDEVIRELILDKKKCPDVIICLNSIDTACAYQAVVDYNKVGKIQILGWGNSETILTALQKNLISATIFSDPMLIGQQCINSMMEYKKDGYVSQYIQVNTTTIDSANVGAYLKKER